MASNGPLKARYFNNRSHHQSHHFPDSPYTPRTPLPYHDVGKDCLSPLVSEDVDEQPLDDFDRQLLSECVYPHDSLEQFAPQNYGQQPALYAGSPEESFEQEYGYSGRNPIEVTGFGLVRPGNDARSGLLSSSDSNPLSSPTRALSLSRARPQLHEPRNRFEQRAVPPAEPRTWQHHEHSSYSNETMPVVRGIRLVAVSELPDRFRAMYPFPNFNAVQSKCFPTAYGSNNNLVVSAPTGSGKTVVMELAIFRIAQELKAGSCKAVYQAPTKSLCSERFRDWKARFSSLDIECAELTGDTEFNNLRNVAGASIIVTTPEKWDSVTRKWKDNAKLMEMIKLFLIDEVHILKDSRGATLEAVVSRMKSVGSGVRFVALSATVPNSDDVAKWLTLSDGARDQPAVRQVFDDTFRPVLLEKHVLSYQGPSNPFAFDALLTEKVPRIVAEYSKRKPVMVFCPTKESAHKTAKKLAEVWQDTPFAKRAWDQPPRVVSVEDDRLKELAPCGVAFHHASLHPNDRKAIERAFLEGNINIICSTSTLAMGVNLPCYLVIVKGTSGYSDNGLQEYSSLEMIQMLGRAGRPQFESEARAVVTCQDGLKAKYDKMVAGEDILESSLHKNLIEHLNAEIGIGTINSVESAKQWLAGTFLQIRLQRNPSYYDLKRELQTVTAENVLKELCERDLQLLQDASLVQDSGQLRCTEFGDAMARYYVQFETMKTFVDLTSKAKISDILVALSKAAEFKDYRMRGGERGLFKDINKANEIRYPFTADITTPRHKVSLLVQAKLGGVQLDKVSKTAGSHVRQVQVETAAIISHCMRLVRCLTDVVVHKSDSVSANNALELTRSLAAGVWDNTVMQLKQVPGIGDVFTRKLAAAGITTIDALANTEPHRIELLLSKNPPFGRSVLKEAANYPQLRISVKEVDKKRMPQGAEVKLRCEAGFLNQPPPLKFNHKYFNILFLCETSCGTIVDFRRYSPKRLAKGVEVLLTATVQSPATAVTCHVMCDDIAGTHRSADLQVNAPSSWFHVQETGTNVKAVQATSQQKTTSTKPSIPSFELDDIDDLDLIEAAEDCAPVEIVTDIDELLAKGSVKVPAKDQVDKSRLAPDSNKKHEESESVQLQNGNWTCLHTCKEKGTACKHKCCAEGVKRPSKRRKVETEVASTKSSTHADATKGSNSKSMAVYQMLQQGARLSTTAKASVKTNPRVMQNGNRSSPGVQLPTLRMSQNGDKLMTNSQHADLLTNLLSVNRGHDGSHEALPDIQDLISEHRDGSVPSSRPPKLTQLRAKQIQISRDKPHDEGRSEPQTRLPAPSQKTIREPVNVAAAKNTIEVKASMGEPRTGAPAPVYQSRFFNAEYLAEQERKKQEHREEQKRRWSKLPAWMYEQFGDVVDIVDE